MPEYLISCGYATCTVPESYRDLFRGVEELVTSSSGWEPGALNLAQAFAMRFRTPLVHTEITRLLLDVEQTGDECWSEYSRRLSETAQKRLLERYHEPIRSQLDARISEGLRRSGEVLHVMVHTDPDTRGTVLLESPEACEWSNRCAAAWRSRMKRDDLKVIHRADGRGTPLTNALLESHGDGGYARIRIRVSQQFFLEGQPWSWATLKKHILDSLKLSSHDLPRRSVAGVSARACSATLQH